MSLKGLSLFANVGIAETYLKDAGVQIVLANELLEERTNFYSHLHESKIICGSITDDLIFDEIIRQSKYEKVNFILATPPCQGMSMAGKMQEDDPRNYLIIKAMEAFILISPDAMLIENVSQMYQTSIIINNEKVNIKNYIQVICKKYGYNVKFDIFDAADYGTAQHRKRSFTRIFKDTYIWQDPVKQKHITVAEKIKELPSLESGEKSNIRWHNARLHNDRHILWMKHTPTGKSAMHNEEHYPQKNGRKIKGFATTYKRILWDKPAPTITMSSGSISSQNNVHPGNLLCDGTYSDARCLTVLELLRLTGLPDNWDIPIWANENLVRQVIGEAIPPMLVKSIVGMLRLKKI